MESEREKFRRQILEEMYGFAEGEAFSDEAYHGIYNKFSVRSMVMCYKRACNKTRDIQGLFDLILDYTKVNPADPNAYEKESMLLDKIIRSADKAVVSANAERRFVEKEIQLKKKANRNIDPAARKKQNLEFLLTREHADNGVIATSAMKLYLDSMVFGMLPAGECPEGVFTEYDSSEPLGHPVFSHDPLGSDVSDRCRQKSEFFVALSNYANDHPYELTTRFIDCGNGFAVIKLSGENGPVYLKVDKEDVYFDWIIVDQNPTLWPGLLCNALAQCGYDPYTADPKAMLQMVGAEDVPDDYLTKYVPVVPKKTQALAAYEGYFICLDDIYIALFATENIDIEEDKPFMDLLSTVKSVMGSVFDYFSDDLDLLAASMDYLKQKSDEYRKENSLHNRSKRLNVCDSIDQLCEIYADPDLRFNPVRVFKSVTGRNLSKLSKM